jgi:hypothetical protein
MGHLCHNQRWNFGLWPSASNISPRCTQMEPGLRKTERSMRYFRLIPSLKDHAVCCHLVSGMSVTIQLELPDALVTGDQDLLRLKSFGGIPIMDAAEALRRLGLS